MNMFTTGNKVKLNPAVLEDQSVKTSHHFFQEALRYDLTGLVIEIDTKRSSTTEFWYRVQFHSFTAPLKEDHIILLSKE